MRVRTHAPNPRSYSFSKSYGSMLLTSLTDLVLWSSGCSPWRPGAAMGTDTQPAIVYDGGAINTGIPSVNCPKCSHPLLAGHFPASSGPGFLCLTMADAHGRRFGQPARGLKPMDDALETSARADSHGRRAGRQTHGAQPRSRLAWHQTVSL